MSGLLRGGRVTGLREDALRFISSVEHDLKILGHVLDINKAHVIMLIERGVISKDSGSRILKALLELDGSPFVRFDAEDIHVIVEEEVIKRVGMEVGGDINIAKSRNDQVATAIRMALREEIISIVDVVLSLQESLLEAAKRGIGTIIPGYTHLQPAQPTTLAHYLLAQFDALQRDLERLLDAYKRVNLCPMGSGALATTSFPISRERVAELLGFDGLVENSIDAVMSRDFLLEVLAALSIMAVNISRLVEDLILWSSMEFGIIDLPEEFTSTSSIMPQKKNPDVLEVVRARMSLVLSDFMGASMMLKGLPSTYNLDFQEATPRLWEACNVIREALKILSEVIKGLKVKTENLSKPFLSFMAATELANLLTRECGLPFRLAHKLVGHLVRVLVESGRSLNDVTPALIAEISCSLIGKPINIGEESLRRAINLAGVVESHGVRGGPSRGEVERMLADRLLSLGRLRERLSQLRGHIVALRSRLNSIAASYASAVVSGA